MNLKVLFNIVLLSLVLCMTSNAIGQEINFQVINAKDSIPVAHIFVQKGKSGKITNDLGYCTIACETGDSIIFSGTGYMPNLWVKENQSNGELVKILLGPSVFLLDTVTINHVMKQEKKVMSMVIPEKSYVPVIVGHQGPYVEPEPTIQNAISYLYYHFSKKEKEKRLVSEMERQDLINNMAKARYNRDVVSYITGLTNDDLEKYIRDYRPTNEFILTATEYELLQRIWSTYRRFIRLQAEEK